MWGASIEGFLTIGFGIVACYYGFRSPPVTDDQKLTAKWQQWHDRWGKWVKIGGVVVVLYGVFLVLTSLLHA